MKIDVCINPSEATKLEFADVTLQCKDLNVASVLDLEFSALHDRGQIPDSVTLDFLFLASVIYNVDKLVSRKETDDRWTRTLEFSLPVSDPEKWSTIRGDLETCISFLTGDVWKIHFTNIQHDLYRPRSRRKFQPRAKGNAVSLFSGGLDSLAGVIDYLESNLSNSLFLVGHRDRFGGPKSDQDRLYKILKEHYQSRIDLLQVRVGQKLLKDNRQKSPSQEKTFRSRSFLFIVLGMYVARSIGNDIPLLMPENGAIALNVPLTSSRHGSCSTRTAHPFFLNTLRGIFEKLGIENKFSNPFAVKTKGECVEQCLNRTLLSAAATESVSCAKRGHPASWHNMNARGCGKCLPCIYRRASLYKIGLDTETYGRDICNGQVDLDSDKDLADDLRALVSFLRRDVQEEEIAFLLLTNGNMEIACLEEYASVVARSMNEVRTWLQDRCTDERIRERAGLVS